MDIKFLVMDVDGTLTDGMIYIGETGEIFKTFNIKDGCGIRDILPIHGIIPVIITARESRMLVLRCQELGIKYLFQNVRNKIQCLSEFLAQYSDNGTKLTFQNVAYIGDDILDLQCMEPIKAEGGIIGCPNDAVDEVKYLADYISIYNGGRGAVRDFIQYLIHL